MTADLAPAEAKAKEDEGGGRRLKADVLGLETCLMRKVWLGVSTLHIGSSSRPLSSSPILKACEEGLCVPRGAAGGPVVEVESSPVQGAADGLNLLSFLRDGPR